LLTSLGFASVATFGTLLFPLPKNEVMKNIVSISNRRAIEQNQCYSQFFIWTAAYLRLKNNSTNLLINSNS